MFNDNPFLLPSWYVSAGLRKYKPLVTMVRASWEHWSQADADGLTHLAPFIVMFNAPPREIRSAVGGHVWHRIRTANIKTNTDRMVLRLVGGWSLEEAMDWPVHERRRAKSFIENGTKSAILIACRHTRKGERLIDNYRMASDFVRMGGDLDPSWGKGQLKREHDALALNRILLRSDPEPWAKPWHKDIGGYSFSLLKSAQELDMEGMFQRHCCGSYAAACRSGVEIVFSAIGPERATVSWNTRLKALQVKAFANGDVTPETMMAAKSCVEAYLAEATGGR